MFTCSVLLMAAHAPYPSTDAPSRGEGRLDRCQLQFHNSALPTNIRSQHTQRTCIYIHVYLRSWDIGCAPWQVLYCVAQLRPCL